MTSATSAQDRRASDRRRADRRSTSAPSWDGADTHINDSRFATAGGVGSPGGAFARVVRVQATARAVIGVALLIALGAATTSNGHATTPWVAALTVAYAVEALVLWLLPRFRVHRRRADDAGTKPIGPGYALATIGVDLAMFAVLHLSEAAIGFNFAALLVLPVLMSGVLLPRLFALAVTSVAGVVLLSGAWHNATEAELTLRMAQSGLAGIGLFVIVMLAAELAARLAREELAARDGLKLARQQAQLNRLVIQEMADGVMVVDRNLRVRAANPAARALLFGRGLAPQAPFSLAERADWHALVEAVERAFADGAWPDEGKEVTIAFDDGSARTLRMQMRFTRPGDADDGIANEQYGVLLLEDVRTAQARLRQERLAAMGRVSAGVAHEIRNPLAAIAQANALLLEEPLAPAQQRLARMVADNVQRLKRIVDDVMEVAPGSAATPHPIDATASVNAAAAEWAQTADISLASDSRLRVELPAEPLGVLFDIDHLRRVLVNLLDNASRHAGPQRGSVFLRLSAHDDTLATLQVFSDGPPIAPDVERYLFEPFFSSRSRGTGLGLYICRELCERYGASIDYQLRPSSERLRNEFIVTMRRASLVADHPALHLGS